MMDENFNPQRITLEVLWTLQIMAFTIKLLTYLQAMSCTSTTVCHPKFSACNRFGANKLNMSFFPLCCILKCLYLYFLTGWDGHFPCCFCVMFYVIISNGDYVHQHKLHITLSLIILAHCTLYAASLDRLPMTSQIAKFMGPTWGPLRSCRPQMGPMLTPWTLLSGFLVCVSGPPVIKLEAWLHEKKSQRIWANIDTGDVLVPARHQVRTWARTDMFPTRPIGISLREDHLVDQGSMCLNSLRPSDAYMRRWTGSSLVHIMACRLFGAKPLSEPMLKYC